MKNFTVWVCVNHPESWNLSGKASLTILENLRTLEWLERAKAALPYKLEIIDRASPGLGLKSKKAGIGEARKALFDRIMQDGGNEDIIVSLDADTTLPTDYIDAIRDLFESQQEISGLAAPYFHPLSGNDLVDKAMLRYEIYMRAYLVNLIRIGNPYAFTALGSALAFRIRNLKHAGGFSPKASGEDFYLLQKLRKSGALAIHINPVVEPASRYSARVGFGTGPAIIKGAEGNWDSYPIYPRAWFDQVREVYDKFELLARENAVTAADNFYAEHLGIQDPWTILRRNHPRKDRFIKACAERFDGLRILQFLRYLKKDSTIHEGLALSELMQEYIPAGKIAFLEQKADLWNDANYDDLEQIRTLLFDIEMDLRAQNPILDGIF